MDFTNPHFLSVAIFAVFVIGFVLGTIFGQTTTFPWLASNKVDRITTKPMVDRKAQKAKKNAEVIRNQISNTIKNMHIPGILVEHYERELGRTNPECGAAFAVIISQKGERGREILDEREVLYVEVPVEGQDIVVTVKVPSCDASLHGKWLKSRNENPYLIKEIAGYLETFRR